MDTNLKETSHTLSTIRDYIRWAASQFVKTDVCFGQGTASALDEAAALVLHTLHQPYNLANEYLDCSLTLDERQQLLNIIEQRISKRVPSAYLTHEAIFAGLPFYVDERVLVPRSPIAELIQQQFAPWIDADEVFNVLDMCTGSACIACACAYAFPDAQVDAVELSDDALAVAKTNIKKHGLDDELTLYQSDLFTNVPKKPYDIIVSNPPYVAISEWQQLPPEYHAEPEMGFTGGDSGLDLVIRILNDANDYLAEQGILIIEVGSSAETLQTTFPDVPFYWLEFERGGDGVFLLTAEQVKQYHELFKALS